MVHGVVSIKK